MLFCGVFPMPLVLVALLKAYLGKKMSHCRLLRGEGVKLLLLCVSSCGEVEVIMPS